MVNYLDELNRKYNDGLITLKEKSQLYEDYQSSSKEK